MGGEDFDLSSAELRWAGPQMLVPARTPWTRPRLARLQDDGLVVAWIDRVGTHDVLSTAQIPNAFDVWPIQVSGATHRSETELREFDGGVARPDGVFAARANGTLSIGRAGATECTVLGRGFAFGWEADGPGLYVLTSDGKGAWTVVHRSDATAGATLTELGGFTLHGFGFPVACSLSDGALLVATFPDVPAPHPIGLYLARKSSRLECVFAAPPYPSSNRLPARFVPTPEVVEGQVVAASPVTFLAPRTNGGAWVATKGANRILVYALDPALGWLASPLDIPTARGEVLLAIGSMGARLAIATQTGGEVAISVTDGSNVRRVIGGVGLVRTSDLGGSIASNASGTTVLIAHSSTSGVHIARADLIPLGDPRLASPAYDEPPPPPAPPPLPMHERPGRRSRDGWVSALRVWMILDAFDARPSMTARGDFEVGTAIARPSGVSAAWSSSGVVVIETKRGTRGASSTIDQLLPHLPAELRSLLGELPTDQRITAAVWIAADGRSEPTADELGALALFDGRTSGQALHGRTLFHAVKGLGDLAKTLEEAARTGPRVLTEDEQKILARHPNGKPHEGADLKRVKAALAALGVVWP